MADFTMKSFDRRPSIEATLSAGGDVVDLSSALSVKFIMTNSTGTVIVDADATIASPSDGLVRYDWAAGDTNTPGPYTAEFEVLWLTGVKQTYPTLSYLSISIVADLNNA